MESKVADTSAGNADNSDPTNTNAKTKKRKYAPKKKGEQTANNEDNSSQTNPRKRKYAPKTKEKKMGATNNNNIPYGISSNNNSNNLNTKAIPLKERIVKLNLNNDIEEIMYGYGDNWPCNRETMQLIEHLTYEYISNVCHGALKIAEITSKLDKECFLFLLRKQPTKYKRVMHLLQANEGIKSSQKVEYADGFDDEKEPLEAQHTNIISNHTENQVANAVDMNTNNTLSNPNTNSNAPSIMVDETDITEEELLNFEDEDEDIAEDGIEE